MPESPPETAARPPNPEPDLRMLRSPTARRALGIALGALAGASLCLSVMPMALQAAGYGSHVAIGVYLARLAPMAALVMAAGGFGVARSRHPLPAAAVFSLAGLATSLSLAAWGLGREPRLLAVSAAAGWRYGLLGGLILGRVLAPPPDDATAAAHGDGDRNAPMAGDTADTTDAGTAPVDDPRDYP